MELWQILADIVCLLTICLVGGGLASRLGQSPLVGYLMAGMLIGGPGSLGLVGSQLEIEAIAELGVALLLFSLGLEFSVERLKGLGSKPLLGGALQILVTLALGAAAGLAFGLETQPSLALGAMLTLSSTAVVLRILTERGEIEMPHGRNSLGVLLTQDIAVVPLAVFMTVLGEGGSTIEIAKDVGRLFLLAAGLTAALYTLTKIAVLTLGTLTLQRNRELTVLFATASGLGSAWAAHEAGISPALGAFIAGMLLGSSPFATQIRADVSTLRVLLLTLFFGAAGMMADPLWMVSHAPGVAAAATALTVGKFVIVTAIFLVFGQSFRVAAATGLTLAQIGEFAFVLGAIGRASGVVSSEVYALVVSVTIVSFMLTAILVPRAPLLGDRLARLLRLTKANGEPPVTAPVTDVVVVGFGPTGQLATMPLIESRLKVTVIELNYDGVRRAKSFGFNAYVGDATSAEILEHALVGEARLVIVTLPHFRSTLLIIELVRSMNPSATILARSRYHIHSEALFAAGAIIYGDEDQVGEALSDRVSSWIAESWQSSDSGGEAKRSPDA
ncbi:Inner membrane protein YbaL [Botrimarina colliarenosi]|uniref:Inner membrane protein YbaL n=1 Tax=Botrimarina colliarenosi TaxID=2528001 RepID=A0A5C6AJS9_9BACT|nr:cation:proton antiporter [Botrimarina colliarenosi]TWU00283.1 Inner membrane protein YbaL [Botrimarina colliarenosi]